jgi:amino acid transporter
MYARDRLTNLGLFGLAALAWSLTGLLFTTRFPDEVTVQLVGAGLLGLAVGLTTVPLFWLVVYGRHRRIAYRGDWLRAARRGALVAVVVALLVVLRSQDALSLPLALFIGIMVAFVEISLSVDR